MVGVVQRGARHRRPRELHGSSTATGVSVPVRPTCTTMVGDRRPRLLGLELVRDGPLRKLRRRAEHVLVPVRVDLDDGAVGFERVLGARAIDGVDLAATAFQSLTDVPPVRGDALATPSHSRLSCASRATSGPRRAGRRGRAAGGVPPRADRACARRPTPRSAGWRMARGPAPRARVERLEVAPIDDDLPAQRERPRCSIRSGTPRIVRTFCGDVLARLAVAARAGRHQAASLVRWPRRPRRRASARRRSAASRVRQAVDHAPRWNSASSSGAYALSSDSIRTTCLT
jgi:hypothetical protein